ncbi:hypothetical protein, partial [Dermacoccus nishinomiyaensis]|uniref:hypothetical protein n=1 Tax=Dermacoccus nishinomiyaensis TaxID=1274 RepID=UPI0021B5CDFA
QMAVPVGGGSQWGREGLEVGGGMDEVEGVGEVEKGEGEERWVGLLRMEGGGWMEVDEGMEVEGEGEGLEVG